MKDKVIIIGGGLAGLSLANVLKHQGVPYKVYERDASPEARTQGWSISVHFCLPYLRKSMDPVKYSKLGVASAVDPQHTVDGHKLVVFDGDTGEKIIEPVGGDVEMEVYRVNRGRFRQWLLEGLDVEWDKILDHYEVTESGIKVTFKDGTTETGSVLVGADGVNSAVCAQILGNERFQEVTSVNPLQVFGTAYWMDQATRQSFEAIAPAHMMAFGSHKGNARGLFASLSDIDRSGPEPKYEMQWLVSGLDPLESQPQNDKERLEIAKKWLEDFHPLFRSLINETPADKPILHLTIRERFPSTELAAKSQKGRIVLIGDAAHAMTMYRGEGGNHGIQDAAELGMLLVEAYKGDKLLEQAVQEYYDLMLPRAQDAVKRSHEASIFMHGPKEEIKQMFAKMGEQIAARARAMKEQQQQEA
ncbi:hypothetical protein VTP01DRAFT_8912 [Rhizomucor pusillus]|uniref:uncharacterized protein n=1 Tax=Rhizomucor pusillus TaxID=4840 RepID=UPI003742337A